MIPAAFLMLFGGLLVLSVLAGQVVVLIKSSNPDGLPPLGSWSGPLLIGLAGCLWIASGTCFWFRRWWLAALSLILGYASGAFGGSLIHPNS